jgi:hypothetical protein
LKLAHSVTGSLACSSCATEITEWKVGIGGYSGFGDRNLETQTPDFTSKPPNVSRSKDDRRVSGGWARALSPEFTRRQFLCCRITNVNFKAYPVRSRNRTSSNREGKRANWRASEKNICVPGQCGADMAYWKFFRYACRWRANKELQLYLGRIRSGRND